MEGLRIVANGLRIILMEFEGLEIYKFGLVFDDGRIMFQ